MAERSLAERTLGYVPPHVRSEWRKMLGLLPNLLGPGADMRDALQAGGETSRAVMSGDPRGAALGLGNVLGSLAMTVLPGSMSTVKGAVRGADEAMGVATLKGKQTGISGLSYPDVKLLQERVPADYLSRPLEERRAIAEKIVAERRAGVIQDAARKADEAAMRWRSIGAEGMEALENAKPGEQADAFEAWAKANGVAARKVPSGGSYYFEVDAGGEVPAKIRFSDHVNNSRMYREADVNVAPGDWSLIDALEFVARRK